ncbi:MAG: hypothetical protein AAB686_03975, partial [Patescibacteria group bacterium]
MEQAPGSDLVLGQKKSWLAIEIVVGVLVLGGLGLYFWYFPPQRTIDIAPIAPQPTSPVAEAPAPPPPKEEFVMDIQPATQYGDEKVNLTKPEKLPAAVEFKTFSYDPKIGKVVAVSGTCSDVYYTFVVFDAKDDYRKDPTRAKINRAYECPSSKAFRLEMNLKDLNLAAGTYYFFIADQGARGTWYNPR